MFPSQISITLEHSLCWGVSGVIVIDKKNGQEKPHTKTGC